MNNAFWKHPLFIYVIAPIIVGLVIYYLTSQNEDASTNITSYDQQGGVTAKNVTINNYFQSSSFLEKKDNLETSLKQKYNFGYTIFGSDGKDIFIPDGPDFSRQFEIDWGGAKVKHLTDEDISILFPKIIYKPLNSTLYSCTLTIPRSAGYQTRFPMTFKHQEIFPFIEVLEDHKDFVILVIGFK